MKNLLLTFLMSLCSYQYAAAGCGMDITRLTYIEGNYTYDTLTNTYYIHPGDTLYYSNGMRAGGTDAWNLCTLNDSVFSHSPELVITDTGTYLLRGGCSGFEMQTGNFRVAYYVTNAITEQVNDSEACTASYNASTQNIVINYSNMHRQRITYSLYNLSGQQILHGGFAPLTGTDQQYSIDLSGSLSGAGMYIMVMETLTDRYTCKLVY